MSRVIISKPLGIAGYGLTRFKKALRENPRGLARQIAGIGKAAFSETELPQGLNWEFHSHTKYSDGLTNSEEIIQKLFDKDFSVWSPTDHETFDFYDKLRKSPNTEELSPVELKLVRREKELRIIRAMEKMTCLGSDYKVGKNVQPGTPIGEVGIHGWKGEVSAPPANLREIIKRAAEQKAIVSIHHPYFWLGLGYHGEAVLDFAFELGAEYGCVMGLEINALVIGTIAQGAQNSKAYAEKNSVRTFAGSDAHCLGMIAQTGLNFPKISLETQPILPSLYHAIENGNYDIFINHPRPADLAKTTAGTTFINKPWEKHYRDLL